ncbi:MAG: helix-turn-helix domain-containing protein [Candidatus Hydrogenedentes bacterium]|nr:helix-turn-helix domain-containing protein [Candidatus Hydrogenedentota bacterium]
MLLDDLARKIRSQREKRGLKQQDIANALNVSPQAVSKWERGENAPDIAVLAPLSRILGVSTDWLLSVHEPETDEFEATVLVSSVRGAYKKSLSMAPRDFALWANGIFYQLTEITLRHEGVPLKYLGDQYLCFFAGTHHQDRGLATALEAKQLITEDVKISLSAGKVYLGSVGHPDYVRPDIMGEAVNVAFLSNEWVDVHGKTGIAVTGALLDGTAKKYATGKPQFVGFKDISRKVQLYEVKATEQGKD